MNGIFYFGAPARETQVVAPELSAKGLHLLKSTPYQAYPTVIQERTTPSYDLYRAYFPAAALAATQNKYTYANSAYLFVKDVIPTKVSLFCNTPTIIWNYPAGEKGPEEVSAIKDRYNAVETVAQGRPALMATLRTDQARSLMESSPNTKTPSNLTTMNIHSYKVYLLLHRILHLFLCVHQYPLVSEGSPESNPIYKSGVEVMPEHMNEVVYGKGTDKEYKVLTFNERNAKGYRFNMNLQEKDFDKFNYMVTSTRDLPNDSSMFFPFVHDLAREDKIQVIQVVRRYFFGLLGVDAESANVMMDEIKGGWGVIAGTVWGAELAHVYAGVQLAFETGAALKIMASSSKKYQGFLLSGRGYHLRIGDNICRPLTYVDSQAAFDKASPHLDSLTKIYGEIQFVDDMARSGRLLEVKSIGDVAKDLREIGYPSDQKDNIHKWARNLDFPSDIYLPITAHNICRVFGAMTSGDILEGSFPVHHLAIFEREKRRRLLSAFGAMVPSFQVTGGRAMSLTGSFQYKSASKKGTKEPMSTNTIFCVVVPFQKGCEDLAKTIQDKQVLNPVGTPLASRASSLSLLREFRDKSGTDVISTLRSLCGVTMDTSGLGSGKGKRKADDEEEGSSTKKIKAFDF